MNKKFLACLMAGAMSISLAACGSGGVSSNSSGGTKNENKTANADKQVGVEQKAEVKAPPKDAKTGGSFIIPILNGVLSADMMPGFTTNGTNSNIYQLITGYSITDIMRNGEADWDPVVVKKHSEKKNEDGSETFTITLAKDLKWNNGEPVTAQDYVFYLLLGSSKEFGDIQGDNSYANSLTGFADFQKGTSKVFSGVRLLGDYEFSIQVDKSQLPNYYIMQSIGYSPLPEKEIAPGVEVKDDGQGCYFNDKFNVDLIRKTLTDPKTGYRYLNPVTCGAYKIDSVDMGTETVKLSINKYYLGRYGDGTKPHIKSLITKPVATETWADEFANGNVAFYYTGGGEHIDTMLGKAQKGTVKANYKPVPQDSFGQFYFDCDFGPGKFPEVRRAVAYLLDREDMNKQISGGYSSVLDTWATAATQDYLNTKDELEKKLTHYTNDPAKAKKELENGGWTLNEKGQPFQEGTDKIRYKMVDGKLMPLDIKWAYSESDTTKLLNTLLPSAAEKVGMKVEGTKMDFAQLVKQMERKGVDTPVYNAYVDSISIPRLPVLWYYFDDDKQYMGIWNTYYLTDPNLKSITQKMKAVAPGDTKAFKKLYVQFALEFNKKLPAIPLSSGTTYWFYNPKYKNFVPRAYDEWWGPILDAYVDTK